MFKAKSNPALYNLCLTIIDKLLAEAQGDVTQKKEIEDLTAMKANICYLSDRLDESEQIFLKALKLKGSKRPDLSIYLRLGNLFLKKE